MARQRITRIKKLLWIMTASIIGVVIVGLVSYRKINSLPAGNVRSIKEKQEDPRNSRMIDSCLALLEQGDIVVRTGNDITSNMFCQANTTDKTYSHCGIVSIENNFPFIYHSIGGEDNPNETLRRDSATIWFSPAYNLGGGAVRFNMPAGQLEKVVQRAKFYYAEKKKFDLDFNLYNEDKMYCTELVYHVLNYAAMDTNYIRPTRRLGYVYAAVDNITYSPHANWICRIRYK